jgi:tRNA 2-thiouridine synthesizing protein A
VTCPERGRTQPPTLTIDALGRRCPVPVILLAERITEVGVSVLATSLVTDQASEMTNSAATSRRRSRWTRSAAWSAARSW